MGSIMALCKSQTKKGTRGVKGNNSSITIVFWKACKLSSSLAADGYCRASEGSLSSPVRLEDHPHLAAQ